ncbi:MAG: hypothetical protein IT285_16130 [Bdellovibrionales bacterium]|nr:hypothetical protein [Bdellovibrionales bacterium]
MRKHCWVYADTRTGLRALVARPRRRSAEPKYSVVLYTSPFLAGTGSTLELSSREFRRRFAYLGRGTKTLQAITVPLRGRCRPRRVTGSWRLTKGLGAKSGAKAGRRYRVTGVYHSWGSTTGFQYTIDGLGRYSTIWFRERPRITRE